MIRLGALDSTPAEVRDLVTVSLSSGSRLLTVTTSGQSAVEAQRLALLWYDAFRAEVEAYVQQRVAQRLEVAERELAALEGMYSSARDALNAFDATVMLPIMEAQLLSLQVELVEAEQRLRTLTQSTSPADEALLQAIELALAEQPQVLGETGHAIGVPAVDAQGGVTSGEVTVLNPVYVQLTQDLVWTRTRLTANRRSAELLEAIVAELPAQIEALRSRVIAYREERARLEQELEVLKPRVDEARAERDNLLALQERVADVAAPAVVSDPMVPLEPVTPKKLLNMALPWPASWRHLLVWQGRLFWTSGPRVASDETPRRDAAQFSYETPASPGMSGCSQLPPPRHLVAIVSASLPGLPSRCLTMAGALITMFTVLSEAFQKG